jgi:hypothetical protein
MPFSSVQRLSASAFLAVLVSACTVPFDAAFDALRAQRQRGSSVDAATLAPKFSYLRVTHPTGIAILGLDRLDPHPAGPIQVWQSVGGEVLRIQNGRLVGASGLLTEWSNVRLPDLPRWSQVAKSAQPVRWTRERDVMPGYRHGVRDELIVTSATPPAKSALREIDATTLTWFEERIARKPGSPRDDDLPAARYAVRMAGSTETVVYGEQCLAPKLCITWQRWSAEQQDAVRRKLAGAKQ